MDRAAIRKVILKDEQPPHELLTAIREVCRQIDAVNNRFEMECNDDLIESCIYEREALRARYRYLLKQAREQGVRDHQLSPSKKPSSANV